MSKISTITAVDVGTDSIKVIIAKKSPDGVGFDVLGKAENISSGMKNGGVKDIEKVAKDIKRTVAEAEREAGVSVEDVYVNINGSHLFSLTSKATITTSHNQEKITKEDVDRVINEAKIFSISPNKEILVTIPKEYVVDDEKGIRDPVGLSGVRLSAEIVAIGGFLSYSKWLTEALLEADIQGINEFVIDPIAAAEAVLSEQEKELGVIAVNFGAATTGIAVYKNEDLLFIKVIPVGVHNIRNDIAVGLKIDVEAADFIRNKFSGSIFKDKSTKKEVVKIAEDDEVVFYRNELRKIVEARVGEIFEAIKEEIEKVAPIKDFPGGVVLTGGGAKIPNIKDYARNKIGLSCRIGKPKRFFNLDEDPSYSTLCGLVLWGAEAEEEMEKKINFKGFSGLIKKMLRPLLP